MDIKTLRMLNNHVVFDKENLIMDTIHCRRGVDAYGDGIEFAENALKCSSEILEGVRDEFDVDYKMVRDRIFKRYKSIKMQPVGFVKLVGKDELNNYYAVGLYDLTIAKAKRLSALDACKEGYGTLIAVMPLRSTNEKDTIFESEFYDSTINLLHAREINGYKGLEIESYHNYLTGDFTFNNDLWAAIEQKQRQKENQDEIEL